MNLASASTGCGTSALRDDKMVYQISMESSLYECDLSIMNNSGPINGSFLNFYELNQNPITGDFYASETDYFSFGKVHIYDSQNIEISQFETGISPGTIAFDIRSSAGINERSLSNMIYPNPVHSILNITGSMNEKVLRNMIGEEVIRFSGSSFQTSGLPNGMYYIEFDHHSIPFIKN